MRLARTVIFSPQQILMNIRLLVAGLALSTTACASSPPLAMRPKPQAEISRSAVEQHLAITSATIIDGRTGRPTSEATIVIQGDRIVAVGPHDRVRIPESARVIDATGKWVAPGFLDVHTHNDLSARVLERALALGITTIHTMPGLAAPSDTFRAREAWSNAGESRAPRLQITFPSFTGSFPAEVFPWATNLTKAQSVVEV